MISTGDLETIGKAKVRKKVQVTWRRIGMTVKAMDGL